MSNYVGFDKSTPAGKPLLATILLAHARGKLLTGDVNASICSPHQGNVSLLTSLRMR